jgi:hypothetical protein
MFYLSSGSFKDMESEVGDRTEAKMSESSKQVVVGGRMWEKYGGKDEEGTHINLRILNSW